MIRHVLDLDTVPPCHPKLSQLGSRIAVCYERQCLTTLRHDSVVMVGQRSLIMLATVNGEEAVPRAVATIPQALARGSESRPHWTMQRIIKSTGAIIGPSTSEEGAISTPVAFA